VTKVAASIKEHGFRVPLVVTKDLIIVAGHTRVKACKLLGIEKVPCHIAEDMDDGAIKAFRIADNRVAEEAEWDNDKLRKELNELEEQFPDVDLSSLGFDQDELDDIRLSDDDLDDADDPAADEVPEDVETRCKLGDVWQLGEHLILCGDSTLHDNFVKLLGEDKIDLTITDPPYNVSYTGKTKDALTIKNDEMDDESFYNFLYDVYVNLFVHTKEGSPVYVFHADSEGDNFRRAFKAAGFKLAQCLVWVKNCMVLGRQDYHWQHEPILYGWKEGAAHKWYSDRKQVTVLNFDRPTKNKEHPTMKPIDILCYLIKNGSRKGDIVWDSFMGSGSTLIAAHKTGRKARGMELDPKYCDVILTRWEDYAGEKAVLLNGNQKAKG
jgi:site-specific DNA-methyltransferase (adenine-specific)